MSEMLTGGTVPQIPGGLAALQGPPPTAGDGGGELGGEPAANGAPPDPLPILQSIVEDIVPLLHALPDPNDVNDAVRALGIFTSIQKRLMAGAPGGAAA